MAEIAEPGEFADRVVGAFYEYGQRLEDWALAHPIRRVRFRFEEKEPTFAYANSILGGRVEKMWSYCPHVGPGVDAVILARSSKRWILGCHGCVTSAFTEDGEDHRCDFCGNPRPDDGTSVAIRVAYLGIVGAFCLSHRRPFQDQLAASGRAAAAPNN